MRLLRLDSRTKQELIDKLNSLYVGYWHVNNELVDINLVNLGKEGLISYSDKYEITEKGSEALARLGPLPLQ